MDKKVKIVVGICACVSLYRGIKSSSVSDSQKVEETDGDSGSAESAEADVSEADLKIESKVFDA